PQESYCLAQYGRVSAEQPAPESFAEYGYRLRAENVVFGEHHPPYQGLGTEQVEVVAGYECELCVSDLVVNEQRRIERVRDHRAGAGVNAAVARVVEDHVLAHGLTIELSSHVLAPRDHHPVLLVNGQRTEQNAVGNAEERRGPTNAKGKGEYDNSSEPSAPAYRANCLTHKPGRLPKVDTEY